MRTENELLEMIREQVEIYKTIASKTPEIAPDNYRIVFTKLETLFWVMGYGKQTAADKASVALGGDPIDWT